MKKVLLIISLMLNVICLTGLVIFTINRTSRPDDVDWIDPVTPFENELDQSYIQLADKLLVIKECPKSELKSKIATLCQVHGFDFDDINFPTDIYPSGTYEAELLSYGCPPNLTHEQFENYLEAALNHYVIEYTKGAIKLSIIISPGWQDEKKERVEGISFRNIKISSFDKLKKEIKAANYTINKFSNDKQEGCPIVDGYKDIPHSYWGYLTYDLRMYYFYEKDGNIHLNYDLSFVGRCDAEYDDI